MKDRAAVVRLDVKLDKRQRRGVFGRYHFDDAGSPCFEEIYEELEKVIRPTAWYSLSEAGTADGCDALENEAGGGCDREEDSGRDAAVILTLGSGPDRIQDAYSDKGLLSECYMAECLSDELLRQACHVFNEKLAQERELYVERYLFPGGEVSLERMEDIFSGISQTEVHLNSSLMMEPRKSVAFLAKISENPDVECIGICENCPNEDCVNRYVPVQRENQPEGEWSGWPDISDRRHLLYGYQRIFSKAGEE